MEYNPQLKNSTILCCLCGVPIESNALNQCHNCLKRTVNLAENIKSQNQVFQCKTCERWLAKSNGKHQIYIKCEPESRDLMALLLGIIRLDKRIKLKDSKFIWTEPHSKRLRIIMTLQQLVNSEFMIEQDVEVEFVLCSQICEDCNRVAAKDTWTTAVQIRQKTTHKRTILFLEQLIIKHKLHLDATNIKSTPHGIDMYFHNKMSAQKLCEFVVSTFPAKTKVSEQLISIDTHSNNSRYKFTYAIEIVPICKDDLVVLPKPLAKQLGNINPVCLCYKVHTNLQFIDILTLKKGELNILHYLRHPFEPMFTKTHLTEFVVLDIDIVSKSEKFTLADVVVQRVSDYGKNNETYNCKTHLGSILNFGDYVYGYDLTTINNNNSDFQDIDYQNTVVLIKKSFDRYRKGSKYKNSRKGYNLKKLNKDEMDQDDDREYELFMHEIEENPELRKDVNLVKSKNRVHKAAEVCDSGMSCDEQDDIEELPEIKITELMDDLAI